MKTRIKLKGQQLRKLQEKAAVIHYALEKALTDCFLREEIFELLDGAKDCAQEIAEELGA